MTAEVIAAKQAAAGFDVAVAFTGNVDLADATVGEIKGHGRRAAAFAADIADEQAARAVQLIPVLAAAARIACRRMTALHLKALHDSVEQAHRIPAAFGWDRKAAAHAEIFNVLADAANAPLAPVLNSGVGLAYDLMVTAGRAADGMIISSRHRLLANLRAGDADAAAREVENHLRVLHYMWRLVHPQRPVGTTPYSISRLDGVEGRKEW